MCWKSAPLAIYHQILGQNGLTFFLGQNKRVDTFRICEYPV